MNHEPNFDDLVGIEPTGAERERLRRAHELLLEAGPPPELSPALEKGPSLGRPRTTRRRQVRQRATLLLAAAVAVAAVFLGGYAVGHGRSSAAPVRTLALQGTPAVRQARATLAILPRKDGNWPMTLTVSNLPKLPQGSYYDVYLVRNGDRYFSCGTFVTVGRTHPVTVTLSEPYHLARGDTWIVTREKAGSGTPGPTVLRPA
jgi:hypothetical protein